MAELPGQMDIFDVLADELNGEPTPARAVSILETAKELGWRENPFCSFVVRLTRDDGLPFYARWDMGFNPETGKRSWRFQGARAINGQPLAYGDIKTYLADPSVIYPEPPDELCEAAEHDNPDQTEAGALEALKPVTEPEIPSTDWGALLR
jgi:hypothetical protein